MVGVSGTAMEKAVYDPDLNGVIALAQTEADMTKAEYDVHGYGWVGKAEVRVKNVPSAGDTLRVSSDAEVEVTAAGESPPTTVHKTLTIADGYVSGTFRIKYAVKNDGTALNTRTQVYKNGVAVGALDAKPHSDVGYETISQDIAAIAGGDVLTLCASDDTGSVGYVKEFRVYCVAAVSSDVEISW